MKPIYIPTGRAKEYGDYAINIYTGCNHGCYYCFAPNVLHKTRAAFSIVEPRKDIVEATKRKLELEHITDKLIHLCFTCDPYPAPPVDTTPTREVVKRQATKLSPQNGEKRETNALRNSFRRGRQTVWV